MAKHDPEWFWFQIFVIFLGLVLLVSMFWAYVSKGYTGDNNFQVNFQTQFPAQNQFFIDDFNKIQQDRPRPGNTLEDYRNDVDERPQLRKHRPMRIEY